MVWIRGPHRGKTYTMDEWRFSCEIYMPAYSMPKSLLCPVYHDKPDQSEEGFDRCCNSPDNHFLCKNKHVSSQSKNIRKILLQRRRSMMRIHAWVRAVSRRWWWWKGYSMRGSWRIRAARFDVRKVARSDTLGHSTLMHLTSHGKRQTGQRASERGQVSTPSASKLYLSTHLTKITRHSS